MIPELRAQFNRSWTPELYGEFLRRLDEASGTHVEFRCSETPVFLPTDLLVQMIRYGQELYGQLAANPAYLAAADATIPVAFRVPAPAEHPLFVQADFGLIREPDGALAQKLVEIQGFPSIYAFQAMLAQQYQAEGETWRAQKLIQQYRALFPEDAVVRAAQMQIENPRNGVDPARNPALGH